MVTVVINDNILEMLKNKVNDSDMSNSDLINNFLLEKLAEDTEELSDEELQSLIVCDNPNGGDILSDITGIAIADSDDCVEIKYNSRRF